MKLVSVSNYINHHQIPMSNEFYKLAKKDGGSYYFIQTEPMEEERIKMGWNSNVKEIPYLVIYKDNVKYAQKLIDEADVVIFGGTDDESYIQARLSEKKIIFRYSERLYRTGRYKFVSPRGLVRKFKDHTRYQFSKVYLLCSGAYVAGDFRMVLSYIGKKYRFGYFPQFIAYDIEEVLKSKTSQIDGVTSFLWAGRMIDWKHPELAIRLMEKLIKINPNIHLTMVGGGELEGNIKALVEDLNLQNHISFTGFLSPEETRQQMLKSDVFLMTSDYQEGWGAVINEAMNSGCVVIANKKIGAVPFLLNNGENGIIYRNLLSKKCIEKIQNTIFDPNKRRHLARNAYKTVSEEWNEKVAAQRVYTLAKEKLNNKDIKYKTGPVSKI